MSTNARWAFALLLLAASQVDAGEAPHAHAAAHPHWAYAGPGGPSHWGQLEPGFTTCSRGHNQSPVNVTHANGTALAPIEFDYQPGGYRVVNNGHAIQVDFKPGSHIRLDNTDFELKQLHFHVPGEHAIDRRRFPMEAHLVHADAQGHLAVVAVMFQDGADNAWIERLASRMPMKADTNADLASVIDAAALLPAKHDYYRYSGSLTTPPCSEQVRWIVLKQPVTASAKEVALVHRAVGQDNNRPLQPLGLRKIQG